MKTRAEWDALIERASPREWIATAAASVRSGSGGLVASCANSKNSTRDADLIANAVNHLESHLARIEALEKMLREMCGWASHFLVTEDVDDERDKFDRDIQRARDMLKEPK